jgi:hypothetical protein
MVAASRDFRGVAVIRVIMPMPEADRGRNCVQECRGQGNQSYAFTEHGSSFTLATNLWFTTWLLGG